MQDNDIVPGGQTVGYGFNVTGAYDLTSITSQLFDISGPPSGTWTSPSGTQYDMPANVSPVSNSKTDAHSFVSTSQSDYTSQFSQQCTVDASAGCFSGEFDYAYSDTFSSSQEYYYCWYAGSRRSYGLQIVSNDAPLLSAAFSSDLDALPDALTDDNASSFYDFFNRYGTHYVAGLTMGAKFRYYVAAQKSFSSDQQQISDNVSLEYKAVFTDDSVHASQDWSTLGENWAASRIVTVDAAGGSSALMPVAAPGYGDNASDAFNEWLASIDDNPATVDFQLQPLSELCGDKADAVDQALNQYLNAAIIVDANLDMSVTGPITSFMISAFGTTFPPPEPIPDPTPVPPPYPDNLPVSGIQLVLFDSDSFDVLLNTVYYMPPFDENFAAAVEKLYAKMAADIASITDTNYVAAFVGFGIDSMEAFPPQDVLNWLTNCGAKLDVWRSLIDSSNPNNILNYVFIGSPGGGISAPVERCSTTEWSATSSLYTSGMSLIFGS